MNKIFETTKCLSMKDIKDYLSDTTNDDQHYRIENHLLDCPLCTDAVEGFAKNNNFEEDTEAVFSNTYFEEKEEHKIVSIKPLPQRNFQWSKLAAAIAMLLIPAVSMYVYFNQNFEDRLFTNNFETYSDGTLSNLRSGNTAKTDATLAGALEAYSAKDYKESLLFFEKYLENNQNADLTFYAGLSALESNQLEKALNYFKTARINTETYFLESSWYLGLTHLKRKELNEATIIFEELQIQDDGFYSKKAEEMLQKIKK